ncbi:MAG: 2-isopropylmalate synthase, partial [Gammaproteobacteria bacterium]|nr:2-isopropylmalate synthase [Gammaproteobacteria bacterium]
GEYINDKRHGYGTYTFADGIELKGLFENGEFKGNR